MVNISSTPLQRFWSRQAFITSLHSSSYLIKMVLAKAKIKLSSKSSMLKPHNTSRRRLSILQTTSQIARPLIPTQALAYSNVLFAPPLISAIYVCLAVGHTFIFQRRSARSSMHIAQSAYLLDILTRPRVFTSTTWGPLQFLPVVMSNL